MSTKLLLCYNEIRKKILPTLVRSSIRREQRRHRAVRHFCCVLSLTIIKKYGVLRQIGCVMEITLSQEQTGDRGDQFPCSAKHEQDLHR